MRIPGRGGTHSDGGGAGARPLYNARHYLDPDLGSRHMGETRETRLREYLEENDVPVVGLREGAWLEIEGEVSELRERAERSAALRVVPRGTAPARIFRRGAEPRECPPGAALETL